MVYALGGLPLQFQWFLRHALFVALLFPHVCKSAATDPAILKYVPEHLSCHNTCVCVCVCVTALPIHLPALTSPLFNPFPLPCLVRSIVKTVTKKEISAWTFDFGYWYGFNTTILALILTFR